MKKGKKQSPMKAPIECCTKTVQLEVNELQQTLEKIGYGDT